MSTKLNPAPVVPPSVSPDVSPDGLKATIAGLTARAARLEAKVSEAALAAISGGVAEDEKYRKLVDNLQTTRGKIEKSTAALVASRSRALADLREKQKVEREALVHRLGKILDKRQAAAAELQAGLQQACEAWKKVLDTTQAARLAWPGGSAAIPVNVLSQPAMRRALAHAIYAAGTTRERGIPNTATSFPGGSMQMEDGADCDFSAAVRKANSWAAASMSGVTTPAMLVDTDTDTDTEDDDDDGTAKPITFDYRNNP